MSNTLVELRIQDFVAGDMLVTFNSIVDTSFNGSSWFFICLQVDNKKRHMELNVE